MATSLQQPQRVPLARDEQGAPVYITREWLRILLGTGGASTTGTTGGGTSSGITQADFDALTARVILLEAAVAAILARLDALPGPFDPNSVLYDEQGRALLDQNGFVLLDS